MSVAPHRTKKWSLSKEESLQKTVAPIDTQIPRQKAIEKTIVGNMMKNNNNKERKRNLAGYGHTPELPSNATSRKEEGKK